MDYLAQAHKYMSIKWKLEFGLKKYSNFHLMDMYLCQKKKGLKKYMPIIYPNKLGSPQITQVLPE